MPVHRIILKTPDGTLDERMFSGNVVSIGRDERCVKERPNRKPNRLSNYDYSGDGAYFVTVCAKERMEL
ncbi:MAG: hypothetical protein FWG52_05685, partial [Proteobacteria bacterium]|nr:hypothetical protein [Pseudomonadota bacterium]